MVRPQQHRELELAYAEAVLQVPVAEAPGRLGICRQRIFPAAVKRQQAGTKLFPGRVQPGAFQRDGIQGVHGFTGTLAVTKPQRGLGGGRVGYGRGGEIPAGGAHATHRESVGRLKVASGKCDRGLVRWKKRGPLRICH